MLAALGVTISFVIAYNNPPPMVRSQELPPIHREGKVNYAIQ